jgi:lipoprotein-releasing system permease protein
LSVEFFISKRILKSELHGKQASRPIIRIAITSIALAVVVNLITIAVVTGFQNEVQQKVVGFSSPLFIHAAGSSSVYENSPIRKNQAFIAPLLKNPEIKSVHYVAYKPVLLQSDKIKRKVVLSSGKDTTYTQQEIQGAVIKGVDSTYDLTFFKNHLKKGRLPHLNSTSKSLEIVVSQQVARDLQLTLNQEVRAFFIKNQPVKKNLTLVGIYETGLEEFDKKIVLGDIRLVQELNDWGVQSAIRIADTLFNGQLIVTAEVVGGNGNYRYDWGKGVDRYAGFTFCPTKDTLIRLVVTDYYANLRGDEIPNSLPDTSYLQVRVSGAKSTMCNFPLNKNKEIIRHYLDSAGTKYALRTKSTEIQFHQIAGKGSSSAYVGGFEVQTKNWDNLPTLTEKLKRTIALIPNEHEEQLSVQSILETQSDIFVWLGFLDINVVIILTLMILIGIINMGSTLLVMILVRTNFIGLLKSIGANDWSIRKLFLIQAGFLIVRGMFYGNVIGLLICGLQYFFHIIRLNPEVYYLNSVPIELSVTSWLALNVVTLIVCLGALIIPSIVIAKISPVKAIRFQ